MAKHVHLSALGVFSLTLVGSRAWADAANTTTAWDAHPVAMYGVLSVPGGPTGLVGAQIEVSPLARVGAALGAGAGLNADMDGWRWVPRFAALAGYRVWLAQKGEDGGAAGFWLSGAFGPYFEREFTLEAGIAEYDFEIERAYWVGVAFVAERRFASGLAVKGTVGLEYLVNHAGSCYQRERGSERRNVVSCDNVSRFTLSPFFPSATLAVGYAF